LSEPAVTWGDGSHKTVYDIVLGYWHDWVDEFRPTDELFVMPGSRRGLRARRWLRVRQVRSSRRTQMAARGMRTARRHGRARGCCSTRSERRPHAHDLVRTLDPLRKAPTLASLGWTVSSRRNCV